MNDSRDKDVQTEKAIWNEAAAFDYFSDARDRASEASSDHMPKQVLDDDSDDPEEKRQKRIQKRMQEENESRGIDLKEENTDLEVHKKNADVVFDPTLKPDVSHRSFDAEEQQSPMASTLQRTHDKQHSKTEESLKAFERRDFHVQDPPQAAYNKSLRQNGLQNRQQLQALHDVFDEICNAIKRSKQSKHEQRNDSLNKNLKWCIPFATITFCANRIKELQDNPDEVKNWRLMSWAEFKEVIFSIYDHRI